MTKLRFVLTLDGFFDIPPKQLQIEVGRVSGLTYFTHRGRVVAIAEPARRDR